MRENFSSENPFLTLDQNNGGIIIDATLGKISLFISATETASINIISGKYDLELTASNGDVKRLIEGLVIIKEEITN